ncbi:MAG: hypothetical protein K0R29_396 [Pseudobdellovibrio sp.]|jgi:hypothetical protein|nr:hypothetical protein [Pseudobdellovibrio sp.]
MRIRSPKLAKLILALYAAFMLLAFFQNCGQVNVEAMPSVAPPEVPVVPTEVDNITFLKIDNSATDIFRAVFVVDMSNSMFAGACPDSIDTWIPDVQPSINCLGPTGVDPAGNRFEVMLTWLDELQAKIDQGKLTNDQVKILVLPFSGGKTESISFPWELNYPVNPVYASPLSRTIPVGFTTVTHAKNYLYFLWAIESKIHNTSINSRIPLDIRNHVTSSTYLSGNVKGSTGTTQISEQLEKMNISLNQELATLKSAGLLGKSHFELVFFSDGVPKPHPLHIEAAARYVWARKKSVCDVAPRTMVQSCRSGYGAAGLDAFGMVNNINALGCVQRCAEYLKSYSETGTLSLPGSETPTCTSYRVGCYSNGTCLNQECTGYSDGSVPGNRWGSMLKCGQCFLLLRQFDRDYNQTSYISENEDNFKNKITSVWGDWTQNRHAVVIGKLKSTINVFKIQHPGAAAWKMSFVRMDSANPVYATQSGEMKKEVNWIVRAQEIFAKKHRFFVLKTPAKPFELFQELHNGQNYKLGMLYVYNRNLRVNSAGTFLPDTDGDGVMDSAETTAGLNATRSNGYCLDSITKVYSQCVNAGCNPSVDRDGDGLNQCEEITVGTDDFEADTDDDDILDGSELLYSLNPVADDQTIFTNSDGYSNFEHFVKCFPPTVNLDTLPPEKIIEIKTDLVEYKNAVDNRGLNVTLPGYRIKVKNLPLVTGITNEVVVVARVDNHTNPMDKRWLYKKYVVTPGMKFEILLEQLEPLRLGAP